MKKEWGWNQMDITDDIAVFVYFNIIIVVFVIVIIIIVVVIVIIIIIIIIIRKQLDVWIPSTYMNAFIKSFLIKLFMIYIVNFCICKTSFLCKTTNPDFCHSALSETLKSYTNNNS